MIQSIYWQNFYNGKKIFGQMFRHFKSISILLVIFSITFQFSNIAGNQTNNLIDTDNDGFTDNIDPDDDNDGFNDTIEVDSGTDPLNASDFPNNLSVDTDGDSIPDITDPDDDNDGLSDVDELSLGTHPKFFDTDTDGLIDYKEVKLGTNPLNEDTDNDKYLDSEEIYARTDPTNASSYPTSVIANAGPDQIICQNETLKLAGTLSIGNITRYSWDFDTTDGIQVDATGNKILHTFTKEGIYNVTLTVTDGISSDNDTCLIAVSNRLAARLEIVKNSERNSIIYQKDLSVLLKSSSNNIIAFEIISELTTSAIMSFTIDYYTLMVLFKDEVVITFDDLIIDQSNIVNMLTSKSNLPLYNITIFNNSLQIIVYIPHFSTHIIEVKRVEKLDIDKEPQSVPKYGLFFLWALLGIFVIIISIISIYSYRRIESLKYYNKLRIDDETVNMAINDKLKKRINWKDYDSEK